MNTENKFQLQFQPLFSFEKEGSSKVNNADTTITTTLTTTNTVSSGCTTG
jgi:hypothetical protein